MNFVIKAVFAVSLFATAARAALPTIPTVPLELPSSVREPLIQRRLVLEARKAALLTEAYSIRRDCASVVKGSDLHNDCLKRRSGFNAGDTTLEEDVAVFAEDIAEALRRHPPKESDYVFAAQAQTLTPMNRGGHRIDAPGLAPPGLHGLVGGTTWTFGYRWPRGACDLRCTEQLEISLGQQLSLFCSSQPDPKKCVAAGLPFTKESYDLVVSMASSHSAIEDLATRAVWDGVEFGEFSRRNKEIFASLEGREFATLDCHSNGAMLCLAALRSGATTAKEIRLFGPQINSKAAALWSDYAAKSGAKVTIYINNGDPVAASSWGLPAPTTVAAKLATAVWLTNPQTSPPVLAKVLFDVWLDSKTAIMDGRLKKHGFQVTRFFGTDGDQRGCKGTPNIDCHSMLLYEKNVNALNAPRQ